MHQHVRGIGIQRAEKMTDKGRFGAATGRSRQAIGATPCGTSGTAPDRLNA